MATSFAVFAQALLANQGDPQKALENPTVRRDLMASMVLKAAVAAGTTLDAGFASELSGYASMSAEFIGLVDEQTVLGKMQTRSAPFRTRVPVLENQAAATFVDQAAPKPAVALSLDLLTLLPHKLAMLCALTEELVRFSSPAASSVVERALTAAIVAGTDRAFLDPDEAATSGHPASITNGITPTSSAGSSAAQITTTLTTMLDSLATSGSSLRNAVVIAHPSTAIVLSSVLTAGNARAFPDASVRGGSIFGLPLLVTRSAQTEGSPLQRLLVVADGDRIVVADDGQVTVDTSRQASIQLLTDPVSGAQSLVSLWENNLAALRAERLISWVSVDAARYALVSY